MTKPKSSSADSVAENKKSKTKFFLLLGAVVFVLFFAVMWNQSSEVVADVFKLLNFGILCALFYFFFKKKQIPETREKIAQKQAELQSKANQNKALLYQQEELDREIKQQELLARKLYGQIKVWSSSFEHKQQELLREQEDLTGKAKQRAQQQAEYKLNRSVSDIVFSKALENAKEKLTAQFVSEAEGKKFISSIVDFMRKEVS